MLNEMKIKEYCDMHGFSYRYFYDTAIIMTNVDMWRLTYYEAIIENEVVHRIMVEHANKAGNKSGKIQFHTQRIAYDIDWIFQNIIVPHETYSNVYNKAFKLKELLAQA